jgi:hypothetical protein
MNVPTLNLLTSCLVSFTRGFKSHHVYDQTQSSNVVFSLLYGLLYYIPFMTIPSCKSILISCGCKFWWFFFATGLLVGLSPKTLWNFPNPNKNHVFYIVLHLHYFTQLHKTIYIYIYTLHYFTWHKINLLTLAWSVSPKPFMHTTLVHTLFWEGKMKNLTHIVPSFGGKNIPNYKTSSTYTKKNSRSSLCSCNAT